MARTAYSQNSTDKTKEETYLDSMLYVSQKAMYSVNAIEGKEMLNKIKAYSKEHNLDKIYAKSFIFDESTTKKTSEIADMLFI